MPTDCGKGGKLGDRGVTMIFVGFANKHGPDVYIMLNPHTCRTTNSRDVLWLNHMYYVAPYVATTKTLPEIAIPTNECSNEDSVTMSHSMSLLCQKKGGEKS